ncbi:MAG: hypothetical protein O3B91_10520, partial [Actinomycetota bacterium]|nr:hypothetical protein [Actinomycetota bacterium]MDA3019515.1 hypothetical protein [Actinomycetota bacterium]
MKTRFFLTFVMFISGLFVAQQPALAASSTTINFTLNTSGTVGSIGVDAIFNGAGGGGDYDKMVRWSADGRLW